MARRLLELPDAAKLLLKNATLPAVTVDGVAMDPAGSREGLMTADLELAEGRIVAIHPHAARGTGAPETIDNGSADQAVVDLRDGMVWPTFVDMHTHLDKGHIWPRSPNPTGDFDGALSTVGADRVARWTAEDIAARFEFSLKCAYAHGTSLIRTHLDSLTPHHERSFEVFADLRHRWAGRIDLQAAALFTLDMVTDPVYMGELTASLTRHGGLMGGVTFVLPDLEARLDLLFAAASDHGLDIDLHVDETQDRAVLTLKLIAEAKLRNRFQGTVVVGHCCSLTQQPDDIARATIDLVAEADLAVVSLPMCNMYLQDRHAGRTPRQRGVTLFHELAAAGVRTAVASDNTRDPFYAYGDMDPIEVLREAVRILHLDHPLDTTARIVTRTPADILGRPDHGRIAVGGPANLVLCTARTWSEFLSRPQSDRIVLRNGRPVDGDLPDYRDLDGLMQRGGP